MTDFQTLYDISLYDFLTNSNQAQISTPNSVFNDSFLQEKIGLFTALELRFGEIPSFQITSNAIFAAAIANESFAFFVYFDTFRSFKAEFLKENLRFYYHLSNSEIDEKLASKLLIFQSNQLEELILQLFSLFNFLLSVKKPVLVLIDNWKGNLSDRDFIASEGNLKRGNLRSELFQRLNLGLNTLKRDFNVTLVLGCKEFNTKISAEISTPLNTIQLWTSVLEDDNKGDLIDKRWFLLDGIQAAKYPSELLFPILTSGLKLVIVQFPFNVLLAEAINRSEIPI